MDRVLKLDLNPSTTPAEKQSAADELTQASKKYFEETGKNNAQVSKNVRGSQIGALRDAVIESTSQVAPTTRLGKLVKEEAELVAELADAQARGNSFDIGQLQNALNKTQERIRKLQSR